MIINCPNCGRKFLLKHKPGKTFRCPKCTFSAPFQVVIEGSRDSKPITKHEEAKPETNNEKTVVMSGVTNGVGEKTQFVANLQSPKRYALIVTFQGMDFGRLPLPTSGQFTLGRRSNDSNAQIKLAPDVSMSRLHAGMRVVGQGVNTAYQITSVKETNPVFVNGRPVPKGTPCQLRPGDVIMMGQTTVRFVNI